MPGSNQSAAATGGTLERRTNQRQLRAGHWREEPISGSCRRDIGENGGDVPWWCHWTAPVSQWIKIENSSSILESKRRNYLHIQHDSEEVSKSVENNTIRRPLKLLAFVCLLSDGAASIVCSQVISAFVLERSQMEVGCETKLWANFFHLAESG